MRYGFIAVGLMTVPLFMGACHHRPLWFFVFTAPAALDMAFRWETARVRRLTRRQTRQELREALLRRPEPEEEHDPDRFEMRMDAL